jgi:hypothetical protein
MHLPIHDLESSLWVLLWEYLSHCNSQAALGTPEKVWYGDFGSSSGKEIDNFRGRLVRRIGRGPIIRGSTTVDLFFKTCMRNFERRDDNDKSDEAMKKEYIFFFQEALKVVEGKEAELDMEWPEYFDKLKHQPGSGSV